MAIKLFGSSITSVYKSVVSTVSKTVSKVSGSSSGKSSSTNSKSSSSGNKTSTTATSKTVSSNVSSANKQSTTTKYVTNAAAIYNASGKKVSTPSSVSTGRPAQSYATQAKSSTTNSQKSTGSSATVKTTTAKAKAVTSTLVKSASTKVPNSKSPLSISNGRPEQSYSIQKKTSTTYNQKTSGNSSKQAKLPVPVAQKAPLVTKTTKSKKEQSEASYSNNRPKQSYTHVVAYTPTASREGAGQMFYMSKTNPKGAKAGASFATSCIPYVGDAKDIQEAVTGKDLITGEKLSGIDRALTITAAGLPVVSGPMLKSVKEGGTIAVKKAPDALKGAEKVIKKTAPKVKKVANKTDVAEDTAKAMKKKAVDKVKDAKKKTNVKPGRLLENEKAGEVGNTTVVNNKGIPYPDANDIRTGEKMKFPSGVNERIPKEERVGWYRNQNEADLYRINSSDILCKKDYIDEWNRRGFATPKRGWEAYEIHHIKPREFGGDSSFENMIPLAREQHRGQVTPWWNNYGEKSKGRDLQ